jgi:hypothetical protein
MEQRERPPRDSGTYLSHTHSDAGGRFAAVGVTTVVGQTPNPYPALPDNNPWRSDPVPDEPPLGYRIDAVPELEQPSTGLLHSPVEQLGDSTTGGAAPLTASPRAQRGGVGSSPFIKRRRL